MHETTLRASHPHELLNNVHFPSASSVFYRQEAAKDSSSVSPLGPSMNQLKALKPPTARPKRTSTLLIERALDEYQVANNLIDFSNDSSQTKHQQARPLKRVRFTKDTNYANESMSEEDVFLQARIILKILEKDCPELKQYLVDVLRHCMMMYRGKDRSARSDLIRLAMHTVVPATYWRIATDARRRLASASTGPTVASAPTAESMHPSKENSPHYCTSL